MKTFDLGRVDWIDVNSSVDLSIIEEHCTHRFKRALVYDRNFKLRKKGFKCKGGVIYKEGIPPKFAEFFNSIEVGETFELSYRDMKSDISGYEVKNWLKRELSIGRKLAIKIEQKNVWTLLITKKLEVRL